MTRDEAIARIQQGLGFRDDVYDPIVTALKEAQRNLETGRSLPGFLMQESQPLVLPVGDAEVPLPDGFIREWQEEGLWYVHPTGQNNIVWVEKLDFEIGKSRFVGTDPGAPRAYTLRKNTIKFWPARDIAYTLTWSYFKHSHSLVTNTPDNEWLDEENGAPEALIGRAGMIIAADLEDTANFQKFSAIFTAAWNSITNEDELGDEENRPLAMGSRL